MLPDMGQNIQLSRDLPQIPVFIKYQDSRYLG
jgi:hypothetical protein